MTLYKVFGRNSARNRFLVVSGSFYAYTIDAYLKLVTCSQVPILLY